MIVISDALENAFIVIVGLLLCLGISWRILKNYFINFAYQLISGYIEDFTKKMSEKPELIAAMLEKPAMLLMNKVTKGFTDKIPVGGMVGEGIGAFLPMLPKKWQGPAALAQLAMGYFQKKQNPSEAGAKSGW